MTKLNCMIFFGLYLFFFSPAHAEPSGQCKAPSLEILRLKSVSCKIEAGIEKAEYEEIVTESPYATDIDKRIVYVYYAKHFDGDIHKNRNSVTLPRSPSQALTPPYDDSIVKMSKKSESYQDWSLITEQIQYGAQGGAPGYSLDCTTAYSENKVFISVSECYALEEKQKFLDLIKSIHSFID